jgi:signal transduction histidine kinase
MHQDSKTLIKNVKSYFDQNVHDTKNLLNYLVLWLDMPDRGKRKDEVRSMLLEMQQTYMTKIAELRDDFERFLSVATTTTTPTKIESLATWLSSYLDKYWVEYDVAGTFTKEFDDNVPLTYPLPYLSSIVESLLDNAVQYRAEDRELIIRMAMHQKGNVVVIRVQDNGVGIDLERNGDALFQPFQRFSAVGEGKGLSLHLIKTTVEKNGGRIELESSVGEGTVVSVFLKDYE